MATQNNTVFDVIIAGAGPSGTTCALSLRNAGLKVALIDKAEFPRNKICGDAIPGLAIKVLKELDLNFYNSFLKFEKKQSIHSTRFVSSNNVQATIQWKNEAYNCTRFDFDAFLLDLVLNYSQTTFLSNTKINDAEIFDTHAEVKTDNGVLKASLIVACDGAQSILSKKLNNFSINLNNYSAAMRVYVEGIVGINQNCTEVFFSKKYRPGYFWIFPINSNVSNVGFGMLSSTVSKKKSVYKLLLKKSFKSFQN